MNDQQFIMMGFKRKQNKQRPRRINPIFIFFSLGIVMFVYGIARILQHFI